MPSCSAQIRLHVDVKCKGPDWTGLDWTGLGLLSRKVLTVIRAGEGAAVWPYRDTTTGWRRMDHGQCGNRRSWGLIRISTCREVWERGGKFSSRPPVLVRGHVQCLVESTALNWRLTDSFVSVLGQEFKNKL
jgi:hypothetical protein